MEYLVPSKFGEAEFVEKRSRFIGRVWPVESEEEAKEHIARTKARYYDARHNCWCYIIRDGGILRYADDGEPQGTAGQPMLEVFRRGRIENVLCVVTRYFGGILLGAGGLTRAYAHTAKLALDTAGIAEMHLWKRMDIMCPYSLYDRIKKEIDVWGGIAENVDFGTDVMIGVLFPEQKVSLFVKRLNDMTAGTVAGEIIGDKYIAVSV
jgi:uncharacterized YigZ family protein